MAGAATIFALSSGSPPAAIGVVRISGLLAGAAAAAIAGRLPPPRQASLRWFRHPDDGGRIDRGLLLWFPGPTTATGEDLAELHIHGGRAVASAIQAALAAIPGLRPAVAGEFTRRAFVNGAIDLTEAEGLADLLSAETETQRRAALANASGALSRRIAEWRGELLDLAAQAEAILDFSDEDDVATDIGPISDGVRNLSAAVGALLAGPPVERLRDGVRVVLAGSPNAGKSTLLNALIGREAAIVSPIAGTTRDVVEAPVSLGGVAFLFSDTAGLRDGGDTVERIGIARAEAAVASADIVLWLDNGPSPVGTDRTIIVRAQSDRRSVPDGGDVTLSAVTGAGMDRLKDLLLERATTLLPAFDELSINERQRNALLCCNAALIEAASQTDLILIAENLRTARIALHEVVGGSSTEDMLDRLFGRFCIGK